jgi:putative ABC transport system permease protein
VSIGKRAASLFQSLFRRKQLEDDLDAELRAYFHLLADRHRERGLSLAEAQRAAQLEFEGFEQVKEQVREVRIGTGVAATFQDARYAWRALRNSPGFVAIAVLTLALGIGVNAAVFSVVYAVLLRPLPYDRPEQLALIWSTFEKTGASRAPTSGPALRDIRQRSRLLQDAAGLWATTGTFTGDANPEQVKVAQVTPNFLQLLGVRPALGRVFTAEEDSGGRPAIVLSNGLWRRRFGGDPDIIGKGVAFQGVDATILGVLPENFALYFPADSNVPTDVQAFTPFPQNVYNSPRKLYFVRIAARLKPGVTLRQAQEDMDSVASQMRGAYTDFAAENMKLSIVSLQSDAFRDIRPALLALFGGAGFVLLICCVNVTNLLLARASDRRKEIAVRAALGASQSRILRQLITEGVFICALAGAAGLGLGWAGLRLLLSLRLGALARVGDVGLNWPVLAFVAAVSLASVLLFGLAPSFESARIDLIKTLRQAGRTSQTQSSRSMRSALIVCEITLGFVLVIGAGLMIRTFDKIYLRSQ